MSAEPLAVAAACGVPGASAESLYRPAVSATRGVWRVRGHGRSVVVKVLQPVFGTGPWAAEPDPGAPYHWRREAAFYASPVPAAIRHALAPPDLLGSVDLPGGAVGLCLADVAAADVVTPWPVATYARVAAAAGSLATYAPDDAWLSRGWLAAYVARHDRPLGDVRPLGLDPRTIAALTALWRGRDALLAALRAVPETLCHFDFSVGNVLPGSDPPTVIDWAYAGLGPVGADVGPLALESVLDFHLPPDAVDEVAAVTHDAYVAASGLPADLVRLGLCAATAVKFAWVFPAVVTAVATRPPTLNGRPLDDALPVWLAALPHLAGLAETARRLGGAP